MKEIWIMWTNRAACMFICMQSKDESAGAENREEAVKDGNGWMSMDELKAEVGE